MDESGEYGSACAPRLMLVRRIVRVAPPHGQHVVADDEQTQVEAFVRDEFLQVDHGAQLLEGAKRALGQGRVGDARNAAPFGAKQRLDDDILAKCVEVCSASSAV